MDDKMTFNEAKRLSLIKWKYRSTHSHDEFKMSEEYKLVKHLKNFCGLCHKYMIEIDDLCCSSCPFNMGYNDGCLNDRHIFSQWWDYNNDNKVEACTVAKEIYDIIEKLQEPTK